LVNLWNSIKSTLSDKPISDFKYEHLKTNPIGTKNYVSKRQWFGNVWSKKTKELEKKVWELEAENKSLKSTIDEINGKLSELLSAKKEEWPKTIKLDPKKWPKEKPSWEKTWKKNEKNKTNESDENETDEETNLKEAV
jgi:predicted RNase H-like nuclease (RuvC/YqgF family)